MTMKSGQGREADAPDAAAQSRERTESTLKAKSRPKELEDIDKGIEFDVKEELHLRGGAGKSSRHKTTTTRRAPTTRTRGSSGSSQSYVSYGSGGKAISYVSYGSGQEKKYRKPYTAKPRYQMMCCAFM